MSKITTLIITSILSFGWMAQAATVRATELRPSIWSDASRGKMNDLVIEFRQGDELPVSFSAGGDLFETTQNQVGYVAIKKTFWIKLQENKILMSFDNSSFKEVSDLISGSFEAGTGADQSGGLANVLNLAIKANLK